MLKVRACVFSTDFLKSTVLFQEEGLVFQTSQPAPPPPRPRDPLRLGRVFCLLCTLSKLYVEASEALKEGVSVYASGRSAVFFENAVRVLLGMQVLLYLCSRVYRCVIGSGCASCRLLDPSC